MTRAASLPFHGACTFFTVRLKKANSKLLVREVSALRAACRSAVSRFPFAIDTAVILPSAAHMIWQLPPGDVRYGDRWSMIKGQFTRAVWTDAQPGSSPWVKGYWHHTIKDREEYQTYRRMVLTAPVQAGLVAAPQDWLLSSIHRDARTGRDMAWELAA